jgi:hypothetical protein
MIANEVEHAGGAGSSLARMVVLGIAVLALTACVLPAIVMGFITESSPEEAYRERSVPSARGTDKVIPVSPVKPPMVVTTPEPVSTPLKDPKRIVMVGAHGGTYHETDCNLVTSDARATTLGKARDEGLEACSDCGE